MDHASSSSPPPVLPKTSDLSETQKQFLKDNFGSRQDLPRARHVLTDLTTHCDDLGSNLAALQRDLTKHAVSWITTSFGAKTALHGLNIKLQNLSLYTSQCGNHGTGTRRGWRGFVEELSGFAEEVRRIENIRNYVETVLRLEALVGDLEDAVLSCVNQRAGSMFAAKFPSICNEGESKQEKFLHAIKSMNSVEEVLADVAKHQPRWRHLIKSVDTRVDKALAVLRPHVLADHRSLLTSLGWPPKLVTSKEEKPGIGNGIPNPLVLMERGKRESYSRSFSTLCALQHAQTKREDRQRKVSGKYGFSGLWAIQELVSPIASRMEHHFSKWVDRPELIFALVGKFTRDFVAGVDDVLQPLIDEARLVSCSAREAWVSAMVQMLSGFLAKRIFPVLIERYGDKESKPEAMVSWLHLMDLLVAFDKQMKSLVNSEIYVYLSDVGGFEGASGGSISSLKIFCEKPDWLKLWAKIELKDACKKLKPEISDSKAWKIHTSDSGSVQFVLSTREDHKAPRIADSAVGIAWKMILRSESFPTILPRIRFVRSSAGRFLWYFFNVLLLHCKRRSELDPEDLDDDGFLRLCASINAARYVKSKLREWSDDVAFVEMKLAENDPSDGESSFFGEEMNSLAELDTNWLLELIGSLLREFESLSSQYIHDIDRFALEDDGDIVSEEDPPVSDDLVEALDMIRTRLGFLRTYLNSRDFTDLWRSVLEGLDHFVSRGVVMGGRVEFSRSGAGRFEADMGGLLGVFRSYCARPEAFAPCVRDTLAVLRLGEEEVGRLRVALCGGGGEDGAKRLRAKGVLGMSVEQAVRVLRSVKFGR